jgi:hypothetical protein
MIQSLRTQEEFDREFAAVVNLLEQDARRVSEAGAVSSGGAVQEVADGVASYRSVMDQGGDTNALAAANYRVQQAMAKVKIACPASRSSA